MTGTIRIMTWNVHGTFNLNPKFDLDGVCSLIRHWAPDVVALQEVDSRGEPTIPLRSWRRPSAITGSTPGRSSRRMAITDRPCSAAGLSPSEPEVVDVSYQEREPRRAICARILSDVAGEVRVIATHLGLSIHERHAQAHALVDLVQPTRTFVVGDFNDWFWVRSVRGVLAQTCPVRTRLRTFPALFPLMRLDRIYVSRDGVIRSAWTDRKARMYSDHLPVIADVVFPD